MKFWPASEAKKVSGRGPDPLDEKLLAQMLEHAEQHISHAAAERKFSVFLRGSGWDQYLSNPTTAKTVGEATRILEEAGYDVSWNRFQRAWDVSWA